MSKLKPDAVARKDGDGYLRFLAISGFALFAVAMFLYQDEASRFTAYRAEAEAPPDGNIPVMRYRNGIGIPECPDGAPETLTLGSGTAAFRCPS